MQISCRSKGFATLAGTLALLMLIPVPIFAAFGIEDTVEPGPVWSTVLTSQYAMFGHIWAQDISTTTKIVEEIAQVEKVYGVGMQMYNLGNAMAHSFGPGQKMQWVAVAQMAVKDFTDDQAAKGWSGAVSGNPGAVPNAWKVATLDITTGAYLASQTPGASPAIARMASIAALDGSSQKCLETISQYRGNALQNQLGPVLKLAIAHLDGTSGTNSEIEQLNLLNAHNYQGNTELRAQGQINACAVEQQIISNKIQRDQQVEDLNRRAANSAYLVPMASEDTAAALGNVIDR